MADVDHAAALVADDAADGPGIHVHGVGKDGVAFAYVIVVHACTCVDPSCRSHAAIADLDAWAQRHCGEGILK